MDHHDAPGPEPEPTSELVPDPESSVADDPGHGAAVRRRPSDAFERLLHRPEHAWLAAAVGLHAPRPQPAYVRRTRVSRADRGPGRATT